MKILVLDNYDSFTYNLVQYIRALTGFLPDVARNDAIRLDEIEAWDAVLLSPGPGLPHEAGIMPALIRRYFNQKPILGICLGHQAIGEAFGGRLENLSQVFHGVSTPVNAIELDDPLFIDMPASFDAGRYHSWVVSRDAFPDELRVLCQDTDGRIMAIRHKSYPVYGVQFHPESIMTPLGKKLIDNFLQMV